MAADSCLVIRNGKLSNVIRQSLKGNSGVKGSSPNINCKTNYGPAVKRGLQESRKG